MRLSHNAVLIGLLWDAFSAEFGALHDVQDPEKHVFHLVTDKLNFGAMNMWFLLNPPGKATIHVENVDEFKWLNSSYCPVLRQLESAAMKEYYFKAAEGSSNLKYRNPKYLSMLNHLRFYLPQVYPKLDKILFLDDDIVVQKDLTGLWAVNLNGNVNGAVETCGESFHRFDKYLNFSNPHIAKNFDPNACGWAYGMNIFDLKVWKKKDITGIYHKWQNMVSLSFCFSYYIYYLLPFSCSTFAFYFYCTLYATIRRKRVSCILKFLWGEAVCLLNTTNIEASSAYNFPSCFLKITCWCRTWTMSIKYFEFFVPVLTYTSIMILEWRSCAVEAGDATSRSYDLLWAYTSTSKVMARSWIGLQSKRESIRDSECSCYTLQWEHEALVRVGNDNVQGILDQVYKLWSSIHTQLQAKWMIRMLKIEGQPSYFSVFPGQRTAKLVTLFDGLIDWSRWNLCPFLHHPFFFLIQLN